VLVHSVYKFNFITVEQNITFIVLIPQERSAEQHAFFSARAETLNTAQSTWLRSKESKAKKDCPFKRNLFLGIFSVLLLEELSEVVQGFICYKADLSNTRLAKPLFACHS
jgi:hypothetical protein